MADKDMTIQLERTRLNLWNVGAVVVGIAVNAFALGAVWTKVDGRLTEGEQYRVQRSTQTDANFAAINAKLTSQDTDKFRLTQLETVVTKNQEAQSARIDRIVESFGGKLDDISEKVNGVQTDVRVLTQRLDARPGPTRAMLEKPIPYR